MAPDSLSPIADVYESKPVTRLDTMAANARARSFAWESVKGIREDVQAFYLDGLAMLRRGKAAGIDADALDRMARALHDTIGDLVGKMERTLDEACCNLDPAQVDRAELDAFMQEGGK